MIRSKTYWYLVSVALPLVLSSLALCLLVLFAAGHPSVDTFALTRSLWEKNEMALQKGSPKLLIVGGSNAYYGIRARALEQALDLPTVNMALFGGLGTDLILFEARQALHPGDYVVLALEYVSYSSNRGLNDVSVEISLARGIDYFLHLPWDQKGIYLRHLQLKQLLKMIESRFDANSLTRRVQRQQIRSGQADAWGDMRLNQGTKYEALLADIQDKQKSYPYLDRSSAAIRSVQRFIRWAQRHQITIWATWPNTIDHAPFQGRLFEITADTIQQFYADLGVPMIGQPELARLPLPLMYDTIYHPNQWGAALRTGRLITVLCEQEQISCLREDSGDR